MLTGILLTKFECLDLIPTLIHHNILPGGRKVKDKPSLNYFKKKFTQSKSAIKDIVDDTQSKSGYVPSGLEPVDSEKEICMTLGIDWGSDITGYDETEDLETLSSRVQEEDRQHKLKLIEICSSWTQEDVHIACGVFARTYPDIMYETLQTQHRVLSRVNESINELSTSYQKGCL